MEYPRYVFKNGGPHERAGGSYDSMLVHNDGEYTEALTKGWSYDLTDAINAHGTPASVIDYSDPVYESELTEEDEIVDEISPPTRHEMEAKAKSLGIKAYWKMSDDKLLEKIGKG